MSGARNAAGSAGPATLSPGYAACASQLARLARGSLTAWLAVLAAVLLVPATASAVPGVLTAFGEGGSGPGQFGQGTGLTQGPRGVAVDPDTGNLYVVDTANERVQLLSPTGQFISQLGTGSVGTVGGAFQQPQGVAVDRTDGSVYVTDRGNFRVQKFNAAGAFLRAWGFNVDNVNPSTAFELCLNANDCRTGTQGTGNGQFGNSLTAGFVSHPAVHPTTGTVYVPDPGGSTANRRVQIFNGSTTDPVAVFEGKFGTSATFGTVSPSRVAIDASGAVYVVNHGNSRVDKCVPSGTPPNVTATCTTFVTYTSSTRPVAIAVNVGTTLNPGNGNVLVAHRAAGANGTEVVVDELTPAGTPVVGATGYGAGAGIGLGLPDANMRDRIGLAVDVGLAGATGRIYLTSGFAGTQPGVYVLGQVAAPTVTLDPVDLSSVTGTKAELAGTINPNGESPGDEVNYRFELSTDGGTTWDPASDFQTVSGGTTSVPVSFSATGLVGGQAYQVRIVTTKPFGNPSATSNVETFSTDPSAPLVAGPVVEQLRRTSLVLRATVNPSNSPSSYRFEFGSTPSYGTTLPVPDGSLGDGNRPVGVSQFIGDLQPGMTYHYRLVTTNGVGVTATTDRTVRTPSEVAAPQGRGYELVTPANKSLGPGVGMHVENSDFDGDTGVHTGLPSVDGEQFGATTVGGTVLAPGAAVMVEDFAFAKRAASSWMSSSAFTNRNYGSNVVPFFRPVQISDNFAVSLWAPAGGLTYLFPEMAQADGSQPFGTNPHYLRDAAGAWRLLTPTNTDETNPHSLAEGGSQLAADGSTMSFNSNILGMLGAADPSLDQVGGFTVYATNTSTSFSNTFADRGPIELVSVCTAGTLIPSRVDVGGGNFEQGARPCPPVSGSRSGVVTDPRGAALRAIDVTAQENIVSADGDRTFFMSPDPAFGGGTESPGSGDGPCAAGVGVDTACPAQLFVRVRSGGARTVRWLSRTRVANQDASLMAPVYFDYATPDGDKVFLRTKAPLTPDDPNGACGAPCTTGTPDPNSWDVFMYDFPDAAGADPGAGQLTRISRGPSGTGDGNVVQDGLPAKASAAVRFASDDGNRVYFTTSGELPAVPAPSNGTSTSPAGTTPGTADTVNLYVYDATGSGPPSWRFVARLPRNVFFESPATCASTAPLEGDVRRTAAGEAGVNAGHTVNATRSCVRGNSDGSLVTFWTPGRLVVDDPDEESVDMYAYDAEADDLHRMSAPQGGVGGDYECVTIGAVTCHGDPGYVVGASEFTLAAKLGVLTDRDGSGPKVAYFQSRSRLVAADADTQMDVYEWRDGVLSLVSTGIEDTGAYYAGNSTDGQDVFILTSAALTWQDIDMVRDIYDVRVGGGFAEPPPPVVCDVLGGGCQNVPATAAVSTQQQTSSAVADGNAGAGRRVALALSGPGAKARRSAARSGILRLRVRTSAAGVVRVGSRARLRRGVVAVGGVRKWVASPGTTTIDLRLSRRARAALRSGRVLAVAVRVSQAGARTRTVTVRLKRSSQS